MSTLSKIITIVAIVFEVIKYVGELIKLVEAPGFGKEKKEAVLVMVGKIYDGLAQEIDLPISKERLLSIVDNVIDVLVAIYNVVGIFRTSKTTPNSPNNT